MELQCHYDGIALKHLQIKKLNGKEFNINNVKTENKMEKKSMFDGMFESFKAQFIPQEEAGLRVASDFSIVVPNNDGTLYRSQDRRNLNKLS
jgi:hypothetical protein